VTTQTDAQGRLYLPKELRDRYGERYHIVEYEDRIELIPVSEDPLSAVREAAGELRGASIEAIREDIAEAAEQDARDSENP